MQDQLSADLYNFASKEGDYARYYVMVSAPQFTGNGNANMERSTVTVTRRCVITKYYIHIRFGVCDFVCVFLYNSY